MFVNSLASVKNCGIAHLVAYSGMLELLRLLQGRT